jgi:fibronectin-binding autotransporter adhesin
MARNSWLEGLIRRVSKLTSNPNRKRSTFRLSTIEKLEDRLAPANVNWTGALSTSWNDPGNWSPNQIPANGDTLIFNTATAGLVNFTANNDIAGLTGLTINIVDADAVAARDFTLTGVNAGIVSLSNNKTDAVAASSTKVSMVMTGAGATITATAGKLGILGANTFDAATNLNVPTGASVDFNILPANALGSATINLTGGTLNVVQVDPIFQNAFNVTQTAATGNPTTFAAYTPNPALGTDVQPFPMMADINVTNGSSQLTSARIWNNTTSTYSYTGQIFIPDSNGNGTGTISFAENNDDDTYMYVDGNTTAVIADTSWNVPKSSGPLTLSTGWHDIEIRFGNTGGGAGSNAIRFAGNTADDWIAGNGNTQTPTGKGFGYRLDTGPNDPLASSINGNDYRRLYATPTPSPVTAATETGTTVTVTTQSAHGFRVGEMITIAGMTPAGYNGTYAVTAITATTFTYTNPVTGLAAATVFGTATRPDDLVRVRIPVVGNPTSTNAFNVSGTSSITLDSKLAGATFGALSMANGGSLNVTSSATAGATLNFATGSLGGGATFSPGANTTLRFVGAVADAVPGTGTAGAITKAGTGTMILNVANSYSGLTTVSGGVLVPLVNGALGTSTGATDGTVVASGAQLQLRSNYSNTESLTLSGTGTTGTNGALTSDGANSYTYSGPITLQNNAWIASSNNTLTLAGGINIGANRLTLAGAGTVTVQTTGITGSGSLSKLEGGTTILNVASPAFTGNVDINAGTLRVSVDGALGTVAGVTNVAPGASLRFVGPASGTLTYATLEPINIAGAGASGAGAINSTTGNVSLAAPINMLGDATIGSGTAAFKLTLAGTLTMPAVGNLTFTGPGNIDVAQSFGNGAAPLPPTPNALLAQYLYDSSANRTGSDLDGLGTTPGVNGGLLAPGTVWAGSALLKGPLNIADAADPSVSSTAGGFASLFGVPSLSIANFVVYWTGRMTVTAPGDYRFATGNIGALTGLLAPDSEGRVYVDLNGNRIFENTNNEKVLTANAAAVGTASTAVHLNPGTYDVAIPFTNGGGSGGFNISFSSDNGATYQLINPGAGTVANTNFSAPSVIPSNSVISNSTGTVTLLAANTYNGTTTINSGTLAAANAGALGVGPAGTVVKTGGSLGLTGDIALANEPVTFNGVGAGSQGALVNISGANSFTGTLTAENVSQGAASIGSNAGTLTVNGTIDLKFSRLNISGSGDVVINSPIVGLGVTTASDGISETIFNNARSNNPDAQTNIEGWRAFATAADDGKGTLTTQIDYQDDGSAGVSVATRAAALGAAGFDAGDWAGLWVTTFTPNESGAWKFRAFAVDDNVGFWIDTDKDGVFQSTANRFGNRACCGDTGDYTTPALVAGQKYLLGIIVTDTGGGGIIRNVQFQSPTAAGAGGGVYSNLNPTLFPGLFQVSFVADNSLVKSGSGALTLAGANTFNGNTTITGGTVNYNSATAFGAPTTASTLTVSGATTVVNLFNNASAVTTVGKADFSAGTGTFNTGALGGKLAVKTQLKTGNSYVVNGDMTVAGANIIDNAAPRTLTAVSGPLDISHVIAISSADKGSLFLNGATQNNSFNYTAAPNAKVLVVSIATRSNVQNIGFSALTYGGVNLVPGSVSQATASSYHSSFIYYLNLTPAQTNTSLPLVVNFNNAITTGFAVHAMTLDGVDTSVAPTAFKVTTTETANLTQPIALTGITAGSAAISTFNYRKGSTTLITEANTTGNPVTGGPSVITTGTPGTTSVASKNLWYREDVDSIFLGGFFTDLAAGATTISATAGGAAGTSHYNGTLAVFKPVGPAPVSLPNTAIVLAAGSNLTLNGSAANSIGDLTLAGNSSIGGGANVPTSLTTGSIAATGTSALTINNSIPVTVGGAAIKATDGATLTLPATSLSSAALTFGNVTGFNGNVVLSGATALTGTTPVLTVAGGTLTVSGALTGTGTTINVNGGTLAGIGAAAPITATTGGTVSPGVVSGIMNSNDLSLSTGSTLKIEINGATVGTQHDQVNVTGAVTLNAGGGVGATLNLSTGYSPGATTPYTIINNDGADPVVGTFANLPEGAKVTTPQGKFQISYVGGDGNDVVLTAVNSTLSWTGALSTSWNDPGNWTPSGVPGGFFDAVTFNTATPGIVNYTANNNIAGLTGFVISVFDSDAVSGHDFNITGNNIGIVSLTNNKTDGVASPTNVGIQLTGAAASITATAGKINISNTANVFDAASTLNVPTGGTADIAVKPSGSIGLAKVNATGGTVNLTSAPPTEVPNVLAMQWFNTSSVARDENFINNMGTGANGGLLSFSPSVGSKSLTTALNFNSATAFNAATATPTTGVAGTATDNFAFLWTGFFTAVKPGSYTWGVGQNITGNSSGTPGIDDEMSIFIDFNDNGIFENATERVATTIGVGCCGLGTSAAARTFAANEKHAIAIGFHEFTGGEYGSANFSIAGDATFGTLTAINPGAATQAGMWSASSKPANNVGSLVNSFNVGGSSTLTMPSYIDGAILGSLTMESGATLNTVATGTQTITFGNLVSITAATEATNTVTITAAGHTFQIGDSVTIAGMTPTGYNGTFTVTGVTATTFTYTNPTAGLAAATAFGTANKATAVSLKGGATFNTGSNSTLRFAGAVADFSPATGTAGAPTKSGPGTLVFTSANTYTGQTTVSGGILTVITGGLGAATGATDGTVVTAGGQLQLKGNITSTENLTLTGTGSTSTNGALATDGAASYTVAGPVTLGGNAWIASSANTLTLNGGVALGTNQLTLAGAGTVTVATVGLTGSGKLVKTEGGTGRLNVASPTYTGEINVNAGTLRASTDNSLGTVAGITTVGSGATLRFDGPLVYTGLEPITINGNGVSGVGAININGGNVTLPGPVTLTGNATIGSETSGSKLTLSGAITMPLVSDLSFTGAGNIDVTQGFGNGTTGATNNLIKNGAGTVTLLGTNTYNGTTTINAGTLVAPAAVALGNTSGVAVKSGGTLGIQGGFNVAVPLNLVGAGAGGVGALNSISGTNNVTAPVTISGNATIGAAAGVLNLNSPITLAAIADVTFTGAGNINVAQAFGNGNAPITINALKASFLHDSSSGRITTQLDGIGAAPGNGGMASPTTVFEGTGFVTGPFNFGDTADPATPATANPNSFSTLFGVSSLSIANFDVYWSGKLNVTTAGTYRFAFTSQGGANVTSPDSEGRFYVDLDKNGIFLDSAGERLLNAATTVTATGTALAVGSYNVAVALTNGSGSGALGLVFSSDNGATWKVVNPSDPSQAGVWTTTATPNNSVIKTGAGTLTLAATNTYNGNTTVGGGTLATTANNALGANPASVLTVAGGTVNLFDSATGVTTVGKADFSAGTNTVNTGALGGKLAIKSQLKLAGGYTVNGDMTVQGANVADNAAPRTLTGVTGTLDITRTSTGITVDPAKGSLLITAVSNNNTVNYTADPSAKVLVVAIGNRHSTTGLLPSTITYGGQALTSAVNVLGTNSTFINGYIYYLMNPPVGQSLPLVVNWNVGSGALSSDVVEAFTLSGVDTTVAPVVGSLYITNSLAAITVAANVAVAGSAAVTLFNYRKGSATTVTETFTNGTPVTGGINSPLSGTATTTTPASGNLWIREDTNLVVGGGLVTGLTPGTISMTDTAPQQSGSFFLGAIAVFAPLITPTNINLPATNVSLASGVGLSLNAGGAATLGDLTLAGNSAIGAGATPPSGLTIGNVTATGTGALTINNGIATTLGGATFKAADGATLTLPAVTIPGAALTFGNATGFKGNVVLGGATNLTGTTPALNVAAGTLTVDGTLASTGVVVNVAAGATLGGGGTVSKVVSLGGSVAPGSGTATGKLNTGDLSLNSASSVKIDLNGTTVGTLYDQINVTGTVNLNSDTGAGASLTGTASVLPAINNSFTIINNDGADPIVGTFAGLPEGGTVTIGTQKYKISYVGGDGNDVTLAAVFLTWTGAVSTSWNNAGNWTPNRVPVSNDILLFDSTTAGLVNFTSNNDIASLTGLTITIVDSDAVAAHDFSLTGLDIGFFSVSSNKTDALTTSSSVAMNLTGASPTFDVAAGRLIVSGTIGGAGALTKNGAGTLLLSSNNAYGGATNINAGTLSISAPPPPTSVTYRYFRFTTVNTRVTTANSVQFSEFQVFNGATQVPTTGAVASNPSNGNQPNEGPDKAIDGLLTTKFLDFNKGPLTIDFGSAKQATQYRFGTANDATERDPIRWRVEGSLDNVTFVVLDDRTGADQTVTTTRGANVPSDTTFFSLLPSAGIASAIPNGSALNVAAGATFDLNGFSEIVASLSGAGTAKVLNSSATTPGTLTLAAGTGTTTYSGSILTGGANGVTNLTKTGASTLILNNPDITYGATVTNGAGTLQLGDGTVPITSLPGGAIVNNGTLTINHPTGAVSSAAAISGTGGVNINGAGTLTLTGASSYSGATAISGVSTVNASGTAFGTSTVTVAAGGNVNATGNLTLGGLAGAGNVHANTAVLYVGGNNASTAYTGVIDGSGPAPGAITYQYFRFTPITRLASANSVQMSEIQFFNNGTQIPTVGAIATNPGGNNPATELPANAIDNNATTKWLDFNKQPLIVNFGSPQTVTDYRLATANDATDRDPLRWKLEGSADGTTWTLLDDRTGGDQDIPTARNVFVPEVNAPFYSLPPISTLVKVGTGALTLSSNTYTGATTINNGSLVATGNASLGAGAAPIIVRSGGGSGNLALTGGSSYAFTKPLFIAGGGASGALKSLGGTTSATFTSITLPASAAIGADGGTFTLPGNITLLNNVGALTLTGAGNVVLNGNIAGGTAGLTKTGAGTATLGGTNVYSGGTTVSAGMLVAPTATALGTTSGVTVTSGGTLGIQGGLTLAMPFTLSGAGAGNVGAINNLGGANTISGAITIPGSGAVTVPNNVAFGSAAGVLNINGTVALPNVGDVTFSGAGDINVAQAFGNGNATVTSNALFEQWYDLAGVGQNENFVNDMGNGANGGMLARTPVKGSKLFSGALNFPDTASFNAATTTPTTGTANVPADNMGFLWTGFFKAPATGVYTFGAGNALAAPGVDDEMAIFVDLNDDGIFDNGVERLASTIGVACCAIGSAVPRSFTAGETHRIAIAFHEEGGGEKASATFRIAGNATFGTDTFINPSAANQAGIWSATSGPANSVFKTGAGKVTFQASNTYNGNTTVTGGTLITAANNALGNNPSSTLSVSGGGTVNLFNNAAAVTTVGTLDTSLGNATVNTGAGVLAASKLKLADLYTITGAITAKGANLADNVVPRTINVASGTLDVSHATPAPINVVDTGVVFTNSSNQNNTFNNVVVGAAAKVLIVEISSRSGTINVLPSTITYAGQPLVAASNSLGTVSTFINSGIYYLMNPPAGSANLVVNFNGTLASNYAIYAFTLDGGVDTTALPGYAVTPLSESSATTQAVTLTGVTPGSIAVVEGTYRFGSATTITTTSSSGTLLTTGVGGGTGNFWRNVPTDNTIIGHGALVSNLAAGTTTISSVAGAAPGSRWTYAAAVFKPVLNPAPVNLPGTSINLAAGANITVFGSGDNVLGDLTIAGNASIGASGGSTPATVKVRNITSTNATSAALTFNNGIAAGVSGFSIKAATGSTLTLPAISITSPSVAFGSPAGFDGNVVLSGNATAVGVVPIVNVSAGTLTVNGAFTGTSALLVNNGATLSGSGSVGTVLALAGSTLTPGTSPGKLGTGDLTLFSGSTFKSEINGAAAGTGYDQADVTGAVNLNGDVGAGATLNVTLGFNPAVGSTFTIINNDGADPVFGTFNGLAQGATFVAGTVTFQISYVGGDGNDVVLTAQAVVSLATTTTLVAVPLATTGGSSVMLTATVAPSPGALGTVTFLDNGVALPGASNVAVVNGVAVFSTTTLAAGVHPITAAYSGAPGYLASTSNLQNVSIAGANPRVVGLSANTNVPALAGPQRSRISSVTVTFDQPVTLDANAIALALHTNGVSYGGVAMPNYGSLPTSMFVSTSDNINWVVSFAGNLEVGLDGLVSIKDGVYDVNVTANRVHPVGQPGVNMLANSVSTFHRLFGDTSPAGTAAGGVAGVNFEAVVNTGDNAAFRDSFGLLGTYQAYFDFEGDGSINTGDNLAFRTRFNKSLKWNV